MSEMAATVTLEALVNPSISLEHVVAAYPVHSGRVALVRHRALERWLPPGGHMLPGETPDDAVIREVREELGLLVELIDESGLVSPRWVGGVLHLARPIGVRREVIDATHHHLDLVYAAIASNDQLEPNEIEVVGAGWFSRKDLTTGPVSPDVRACALRALGVVEQSLTEVR